MKTKFLSILIFTCLILVFGSCNKDNDDPIVSDGQMTLKYNGNAWSATLAVVGSNSNGTINVTGSDATAHQASVTLVGVTSTGTYEVTAGSQHQLRWTEGISQEETYGANGIVGSGTVTLTELSETKAVGTFSFTGVNMNGDTREITDGTFEVEF